MAGANENPPLVSYWLAGVGALFGWNESVLHAAMLVPALLAVAGVWLLARVLGAPPRLAGLALLAMPGFLVSSTTLMADVLAMALWTWAVLAWVRGLQRERMGWLAAGAVLAGLCLLTKYVGLAVVPLLFAYTVLKSRRLDPRILLLGVPLVLAFVYRAQMLARYGVDPLRPSAPTRSRCAKPPRQAHSSSHGSASPTSEGPAFRSRVPAIRARSRTCGRGARKRRAASLVRGELGLSVLHGS